MGSIVHCTVPSIYNKIKEENRFKKKTQYKNMATLMETRIYNLLIIMKMGHALDLKVALTKEKTIYALYNIQYEYDFI